MTYDLWDVEVGLYFGRFEDALKTVRDLLDANGDDYAEVLELGTSDDPSGGRNLTGAALVAGARSLEATSRIQRHFGSVKPRNRPENWSAIRDEVEELVAADVLAEDE